MRCEQKGCDKKAKLKLSMETAWSGSFCFKHTYRLVRVLLKTIQERNVSLYIQRHFD